MGHTYLRWDIVKKDQFRSFVLPVKNEAQRVPGKCPGSHSVWVVGGQPRTHFRLHVQCPLCGLNRCEVTSTGE